MTKISYLTNQEGSTLKLRARTTPVAGEASGMGAPPGIETTEMEETGEEASEASTADVASTEEISKEIDSGSIWTTLRDTKPSSKPRREAKLTTETYLVDIFNAN